MMAIERQRRTGAEELQYRTLSSTAHLRILTHEESIEWNRLGAMAPFPGIVTPEQVVGTILPVYQPVTPDPVEVVAIPVVPPAPPRTRIYVKVAPNPEYGRGSWVIEIKVNDIRQELPDKEIIRGFLPKGDKAKISRRRYRGTERCLIDALNAGLSAQTLHDALKAWVIAASSPVNPATSETTLDDETSYLLHAQPATLEVGGKVFKLVPAGEIDVRPLIHRVRAKALMGAKAEAVTITSKAKMDARLVVSSAEQNAQAIRQEVENLRREINSQVPVWVKASGRGVRWLGDKWWIQLNVSCRVKEIRWTVSQWNTIFYWNPVQWPVGMHEENRIAYYATHTMPLWVRLNPEGRYTLDDVRHMDSFATVHTTNSRVCMSLQMMPTTLNSNRDMQALEKCISRGMEVVNLNSPLDRGYESFYPDFKGQIPVVVKKWLYGSISLFPARIGQTLAQYQEANPSVTWDRTETIEQEGAGVFNTETYRPTPPTPTPVEVPTVAEIMEEAQRAQRRY